MGYTTEFDGTIKIEPVITEELKEYINNFSSTRRMKRDNEKLMVLFKGEGGFDGSYGKEGEYFVGSKENYGQTRDASVVDFNTPPETQPGLWCQWIVNDAGELEWDGNEKFYCGYDWMKYIVENFLAPKGYICNGEIFADGEEGGDEWKINVDDNVVTTKER